MPPSSPTERLQGLLRRRKCWLIADLARSLGYALISVRRFLKDIGYFRSYTHNGKWYTLRSTPRFDRDGIWRHTDIGFSKHGSLIATITHLVGRSPAGLSARELSQKLGSPYHAVLTNLHKDGVLDRVKAEGQFRYLSVSAQINRRQKELAGAPRPANPPLSAHTTVLVLVEHIKHPDLAFEQIAANLRRREGLRVAAEDIRHFFEEEGLKKTADGPAPGL